ncbi:DNA polymerase [Falcon aviadenovirus A]|nr:DNA polymerase [Falcon aviadenovirus A]
MDSSSFNEEDEEFEPGPPLKKSLITYNTHLIRTLKQDDIQNYKKYFQSLSGKLIRANVFYVDKQPFKFQPTVFVKGMKKFLRLHNFLLCKRTRKYDHINYQYYMRKPLQRLQIFQPASINVLFICGKKAKVKEVFKADYPVLPPIYLTKDKGGQWVWITSRTPMQKCPHCGRYWLSKHKCNDTRTAFYFHAVEKEGRKMWQHVPFKCPAQPPQARQLFLTYDIETYTVFEAKGKRMHPFILCFMLSGDSTLVAQAELLVVRDTDANVLDNGYYWIDARPGVVARKFRNLRTRLQEFFSRNLVMRYYRHNKQYFKQVMRDGNYPDIYSVPYEMFTHPAQPLYLPSCFYVVDIVVLGHNITKFDELLLATELVERRDIFPQAGKCERSFMPRVGRLLFNDIHFHMPNPNFIKDDPTRTDRWSRGLFDACDMRNVSVRFLVRDTLQLTSGTKLKKAAAAYALDICKGECAYEAVNQQISMGGFEADEEGFPVEKYWEDASVIPEQKELWRRDHPGKPYDIIQACLEYCMQDVKVTQKLAHTLYDSYDKYFRQELGMEGRYNIFERPTIPSNTHAFWKQLAFSDYIKEAQDKLKKGSRKRKKIPHDYVAALYAPYRPMFSYIRQALRGGRCYPNIIGPYRKPVYVFDICGMYASALTHPMPHGMPLDPHFTAEHVNDLNTILRNEKHISYFDKRIKPSILKIEAYPPPHDMLDPLPPICSRRGGRLVWTNESLYDEVITIIDILTLHNRGWSVTIIHDEMNIVFPEWKTICAAYVSKNIAAKEKADKEKNEVMRSISKMLSNALYGAFATNMDTTRVVFEQDLTEKDKDAIYDGTQVIKHVTLLNDPSLSGKDFNPRPSTMITSGIANYFNSPWSENEEEQSDPCNDGASKLKNKLTEDLSLKEVDLEVEALVEDASLLSVSDNDDHAHYSKANETIFKPMRLLDATPESLTVLHLESLDQMVENKRYATQIACFVLGWSRAFFSEWCEILHDPDRGIHPHNREQVSLYGDTDSLFVTEIGYKRMKERGSHRIKSQDTRLTFDPDNPALYWACECDIKCKVCKSDTYSTESVFLAPKLYGLKDAVCTNNTCGHVGEGKIRSKGHRQAELIFDTLMRCWEKYEDELYGAKSDIPELFTRRTIFKTTLLNKVSKYDPFTIHTEPLTRILRPWKEPTLYQYGDYLYPYNSANPNPRTSGEKRQVADLGQDDPLAPLNLADDDIAHNDFAFLTSEECDELLALLSDCDDGQQEEGVVL